MIAKREIWIKIFWVLYDTQTHWVGVTQVAFARYSYNLSCVSCLHLGKYAQVEETIIDCVCFNWVVKLSWAKKPDGNIVKKIVMDDVHFWPSVVYSVKTTKGPRFYRCMDRVLNRETSEKVDSQLDDFKSLSTKESCLDIMLLWHHTLNDHMVY